MHLGLSAAFRFEPDLTFNSQRRGVEIYQSRGWAYGPAMAAIQVYEDMLFEHWVVLYIGARIEHSIVKTTYRSLTAALTERYLPSRPIGACSSSSYLALNNDRRVT